MSDAYYDPPDEIAVLALRCLTHIKNRTGMDLDGRSETLSVVDFFIRDVLTEEGGGELPPIGDHRRADAMHLLAPAIGAYFGEVVRTVFPCRWRMDTNDPREWTIDFDNVPLRFSPIGAAAEALLEQHAEGWGASLSTATEETESLGQRLKAAPPVPEDEFFALTTRFEVLQIAVEWLRAHMALRDIPPPEFYTEEDYDYIFGNR
jgi:hypothetical protein